MTSVEKRKERNSVIARKIEERQKERKQSRNERGDGGGEGERKQRVDASEQEIN